MVASFKISSFHKKQVLDCGLLQQAVPLCAQRPEHARHCKFAVRVLLVGMQSQSLWTSRPVIAAHSCGVLKERFAETRSLHRMMQSNRFGLCPTSSCKARGFVYTKTLLARELQRTRMVPRSTACRSYCIHLNCQFRSQLLYWTHQKFFRRQLPWPQSKFKSEIDPAVLTAQTAPNIF